MEEKLICGQPIWRQMTLNCCRRKVYMHRLFRLEGKYYALTNIGRNPTVGDHNELRIETHVVEFSGDLYDRMITVRIYQRLRDEHKFASLEEVKAQVMKDQEKAMAYFKEHHI